MQALTRGMARCLLGLATGLWALSAGAADFTQPARDAEFIKSARRQDRELLQFYGRTIPGGTQFAHVGSFRAKVHRDGLVAPCTLVPIRSAAFDGPAALRESARGTALVVGALKLAYANRDPLIVPDTLLLRYDGRQVRLLDLHKTLIGEFDAVVSEIPPDAAVDPAVGSLSESEHSLANILPDGTLQIFIQLTDTKGKPVKDAAGFRKILLAFAIQGLVTDDDSPARELEVPGEPPGGRKKDKDDGGGGGGGGSPHHH